MLHYFSSAGYTVNKTYLGIVFYTRAVEIND